MTRSPVAIACVLLALLAAPCADVGGLIALVAGVSGCGSDACCCAASDDAAGSCCTESPAHRPPQLVDACRCGQHGGQAFGSAPLQPRESAGSAAKLPELRAARVARTQPVALPGQRPATPEPPPPRLRD